MPDRPAAFLCSAITLLVILGEWTPLPHFGWAAAVLAAALTAHLTVQVGWTRRIFVAVGLALAAATLALATDPLTDLAAAMEKAAFIAAFFTALTTLRHVAETSPTIRACGRFLADQRPGRRYLALTAGGHLFALLLNYGAIALLGSLATASAAAEPDPEIRGHRTRRMLLAIQRGFVSMLPWSPLAFAMAISTALVPGSSWAGAVLPCLGSGLILAGLGWALDTVFKPKLSHPPAPRAAPDGGWVLLLPLLGLLAILAAGVATLHMAFEVRAVAAVMVLVPLIAAVWLALQAPDAPVAAVVGRTREYLTTQLPGYRGELVLLMMAGAIGTLGGRLLAPWIAASGLDLALLPGWALLVGLVWIIPITGQIGANPILSVSLLAPLLPDAAAMGLSPNDFILAITAGWALGGASSPYTATTLLVGSFGGVSATHVGVRWNGAYTLLAGAILSGWVVLAALF